MNADGPKEQRIGRILSQVGAAFALLPVPDIGHQVAGPRAEDSVLVDVEMLSPDRLVRYLARTVSVRFLESLADMYMKTADEPYPEQSVPSVQEGSGTISLSVTESTPMTAMIEVLVAADLDAEIVEWDGLEAEVGRSGLVTAALEIRTWLEARARAEDVGA